MDSRKKSMSYILALFCTSNLSIGAVSESEFDSVFALIQNRDFSTAVEKIETLEKVNFESPEISVLKFFYLREKSRKAAISISPNIPDEDSALAIVDNSGDSVLGYLDDTVYYDVDTLQLAVGELRKAIASFPDRLDMRMELIEATASAELYDDMTFEILEMFRREALNNDKWFGRYFETCDASCGSVPLEFAQSKISLMMGVSEVHRDSLAIALSRSILEYHPESVYGHANLGAIYFRREEFEESLSHLNMARAIDTTDCIVIGNLGMCYEKTNQKSEATRMYKLLL